MLTPKENALRTLHWETAEYVPASFEAYHASGFFVRNVQEHPMKAGKDVFGVPWISNYMGMMHKPGFVMFEEMEDWEKYVKFPNLDDYDFHALAKAEFDFNPVNREQKLVQIFSGGAQFMRLNALMGMENSLMALAADPESCMDFFEAYTDYRIEVINRTIDAYHPDIYVISEDIAQARGLFMSPECYRKVIKPFHARMAEAINKRGVISSMHICGKCEEVIPDLVEMGYQQWQVAQDLNDVAGILDTYKGKLSIEGGWTATEKATFLTDEDDACALREEVRRIMREYKKPGFVMFTCVFNEKGDLQRTGDPRWNELVDEWDKTRWF